MQSTRIFNIQLSFFGDFSSLNISSQALQPLAESLSNSGFMPSTFGEMSMNPEKTEIMSRPSFFDNNGFTINLGSQRIDLSQGFDFDDEQKEDIFADFNSRSKEYIATITKSLGLSIIDRLALNIIEAFSEEDGNKISQKFGSGHISAYYGDGNSLFEWEERLVSRKNINNLDAMLNIGLSLREGEACFTAGSKTHRFNGVVAIFDINTTPDKAKKYTLEDASVFQDVALSEFKAINSTITEG